MPGRTAQQAVDDFLEPLRRAVSTLAGHSQIAVVRKGRYVLEQEYVWQLNAGRGMSWPAVGTFLASMNFRIVEADPTHHDAQPGDLRVTTAQYHYHFKDPDDHAKWRMHWHPEGRSYVTEPHLHRLPDTKIHWSTPRMSFETAVRWCMTEGAPLSCGEAEADDRLTSTEATFKLFSSWQQTPTIRYGRPVSPG